MSMSYSLVLPPDYTVIYFSKSKVLQTAVVRIICILREH